MTSVSIYLTLQLQMDSSLVNFDPTCLLAKAVIFDHFKLKFQYERYDGSEGSKVHNCILISRNSFHFT